MEYVWLKPKTDGEFEIPIGACILERGRNFLTVKDDEDFTEYVPLEDVMQPMHPSGIHHVEDMTVLGDLQECTILRNLLIRYRRNLIYTFSGDILIALNPYQDLPIYGQDKVKWYRNANFGERPPHLFAIGEVTYQTVRYKEEKLAITINGESGAGKTQSAKLLLKYYASITGKNSLMEERILASNPVLEAFGNARTVGNDNSSRFGKYLTVHFNSEGRMESAEIKQFLLEKSRIVTQNSGERNYHVFYLLIKGLSDAEKELLGLKDASFYEYLNEGERNISNSDEAEEFEKFVKALKILDFQDEEIWKIYEVIASILHLGNVQYRENSDSEDAPVGLTDSWELDFISNLMGVSSRFLKSCLTQKTIVTTFEKVSKGLTKQEAIDSRDAFVKAIYDQLFNFIVNKINQSTGRKNKFSQAYIGILDIFGFENFKRNSFEQLCINLANERLQRFFLHHTCTLEQNLYLEEGLEWKNITIFDNLPIVEMISIQPMSVMNIINDESRFPTSTDESMLKKLVDHHGDNPNFLTPKYNNIAVFGIHHFAGIVLYDVKGFLEKNRDAYSSNYKDLIRLSENDFVKTLFAHDLKESRISLQSKKRIHTLSTKFENSLANLMDELNQCTPFFIKCIKPNTEKKPNLFDRTLCSKQLRYSGVWQSCKIRQQGYPVRFTFKEFIDRYRMLKNGIPHASGLSHVQQVEVSKRICVSVLDENPNYKFGSSKIFLKNFDYLTLENLREVILSTYIVTMQKWAKMWIYRKRFLKQKEAAIVIQKHWRRRKQHNEYQTIRQGIIRFQSVIRTRYQRHAYVALQRRIFQFQARCRGFIARRDFREKLSKAGKSINQMDSRSRNLEVKKSSGKKQQKSSKSPEDFKNTIKLKKQESFLHMRLKGNVMTREQMSELNSLVDESFSFLMSQGTPKVQSKPKSKPFYRKLFNGQLK